MNTNDSAKTIVCWRFEYVGRVQKAGRYPRSVRWTGVCNLLGDEYEVVSEELVVEHLLL